MAPAKLDQVLGEKRHGCCPREDPPAVHAPPVAVLGARHAEDEGDAVSGQERARGPHEHVLAPHGDPHFEHRARQQGDEDLRNREPELERHLSEHLQRDDHCGEMEPGIAPRRQQHGVLRASNLQGRPAAAGSGGGAHRRSCYAVPPGIPERRKVQLTRVCGEFSLAAGSTIRDVGRL